MHLVNFSDEPAAYRENQKMITGENRVCQNRRHRCTEEDAQLHGRQPDAAACAEDDELLTGPQAGDRAQHVEGGAVGHAEGGGRAVLDAVRRPRQRLG